MPHTIVVGAGISGLTCAYWLRKKGDDVLLLESSSRTGGEICSERLDGFLLEYGPNSLRGAYAELTELTENLHLEDEIIHSTSAASSRYILRNGKPVRLPKGPLDLFTTSVLSTSGKLRALREPLVSKSQAKDESVFSFFQRRLGTEVAEYLLDPFVSGIFAGDATKLSIKHAFPTLWKHEQTAGSILKGMMRNRREKSKDSSSNKPKSRRGIYSFKNGLQSLPQSMAAALGHHLNTETPVESIAKDSRGFVVSVAGAELHCDRLIMTTPAHRTAQLINSALPDCAATLREIHYAPVAILHLGFSDGQFANPPSGFGTLVPRKEGKQYLGIIYSSSSFEGKAPEHHSLLTVIAGGRRKAELLSLEDQELSQLLAREVCEALPWHGMPKFTRLTRIPMAIPQYEVGYQKILDSISGTEAQNPGLHFLGSYRGGISIGECVRSATQLAASLV